MSNKISKCGIEVIKTDNGICLSQRKYCMELLSEFCLLCCKLVTTPIEMNLNNKTSENSSQGLKDLFVYQRLVGKLIYLTLTRPDIFFIDIIFVVQFLSQFMHVPNSEHFKYALRVLRYLKGALGKRVHIRITRVFYLIYVDSYWAKCQVNRRSVTGFCVFFGASPISWKVEADHCLKVLCKGYCYL